MLRLGVIAMRAACIGAACSMVFWAGCHSAGAGNVAGGLGAQPGGNLAADPQQVQASATSFAARYVIAMADVYDRVAATPLAPRAREAALQNKVLAGQGALGNAVGANPLVGLMDLALMVTLSRSVMEEPWATQELGAENVAMIVEALKLQEADVWSVVGEYLTPEQVGELRGLAVRWRAEHVGQRYVGGARLADFPESKGPKIPGAALASGIFGLVQLDPFKGLDPAVRQVEESRILAERMFLYLQHMPMLVSWQTDLLYVRMMSQPQMMQLLKDTNVVSANSTAFSEATGKFADNTTTFAKTVEQFRAGLPEQQATLVRQVNEAVSGQREAALKQATLDIGALRDTTVKQLNEVVAGQLDVSIKQLDGVVGQQRDASIKQLNEAVAQRLDTSIKQLNDTVNVQQDLMAKNLQAVMDNSIDRLEARVRSLVLIAAGALLAVLMIHRVMARKWPVVKG